jgi:hypothetical protein
MKDKDESKDEGGRMKDEVKAFKTRKAFLSSFILPPSSFLFRRRLYPERGIKYHSSLSILMFETCLRKRI